MTGPLIADGSNFTVLDPQKIGAMRAAGYQGIILGTQKPDNTSPLSGMSTRDQHAVCQQMSYPVPALYVFLYFDDRDPDRIDASLDLCEEWGLKLWLDCEYAAVADAVHLIDTGLPQGAVISVEGISRTLAAGLLNRDQESPLVFGVPVVSATSIAGLMAQYVDQARDYIGGLSHAAWSAWGPLAPAAQGGIYTSKSKWLALTGNAAGAPFRGMPLWTANYRTLTDPWFFDPYGPWTLDDAAIWQWSSIGIGTVNVDLNVVAQLAPAPAPEEDPPMKRLASGTKASPWYATTTHQRFTGATGVNVTVDFDEVPAEAVAVEVEVELQTSSNPVRVFDGYEGNDGQEAFKVIGRVGHGRANLSDGPNGGRWFHLQSGTLLCKLQGVRCLGYYLA